MSSRVNKPDTQADKELRHCITEVPPRSFIMTAGAGSGKTTSLIKCLSSVVEIHGEKLRKSRQRIACITYTEIAAGEIWRDIGKDEMVHVSTIHSFMWLIAKPFQKDIHKWVSSRINEQIEIIKEKQLSYGPKVRQQTKDKNTNDLERFRRYSQSLATVKSFRYGMGSDYSKGILGHDDILRLATYLITERPLFRTLVASQFPFVFVDESQDTNDEIVKALKMIHFESDQNFCLGFFGDPMQRIFFSGQGLIEKELTWKDISKNENFRCSSTVLKLANAIRRDSDDLVQVSGARLGPHGINQIPEGQAHIFILPSDEERDENLLRVRKWMAAKSDDNRWVSNDNLNQIKLLVLVHQMAARRLQFGDLYHALNYKAPASFKNGFLDGSAWPISCCVKFLIPITIAYLEGKHLEVMRLVREYSPLFEKENLSRIDVAKCLKTVSEVITYVVNAIAGNSNSTIEDILNKVKSSELLSLDPRLVSYLETSDVMPTSEEDIHVEEDESDKEMTSMSAFLNCPAKQLLPYHNYISEQSPFSTQQGIKGAEFDRVLVVLDDEESQYFQFSYEKYLGIKELSETDKRNIHEGKETVIDRTRRLFYVSCTRALEDLAVVFFTSNPESAIEKIRELNLFEDDAIHSLDDLYS